MRKTPCGAVLTPTRIWKLSSLFWIWKLALEQPRMGSFSIDRQTWVPSIQPADERNRAKLVLEQPKMKNISDSREKHSWYSCLHRDSAPTMDSLGETTFCPSWTQPPPSPQIVSGIELTRKTLCGAVLTTSVFKIELVVLNLELGVRTAPHRIFFYWASNPGSKSHKKWARKSHKFDNLTFTDFSGALLSCTHRICF